MFYKDLYVIDAIAYAACQNLFNGAPIYGDDPELSLERLHGALLEVSHTWDHVIFPSMVVDYMEECSWYRLADGFEGITANTHGELDAIVLEAILYAISQAWTSNIDVCDLATKQPNSWHIYGEDNYVALAECYYRHLTNMYRAMARDDIKDFVFDETKLDWYDAELMVNVACRSKDVRLAKAEYLVQKAKYTAHMLDAWEALDYIYDNRLIATDDYT